MKRFFLLSALLFCASVAASAQSTSVQNKDYESFNTVNVSNKFTVNLKYAPKYSVKVTSDERIAPYVQVYVKNGTLFLLLDEKSYTPELKKELKQKGSGEPVLEADISMPTISSLVLKDKSVLLHCERFHAQSFTLTVGDHAKVSQFNLNCTSAEINCSKNASVVAETNVSGKLYVATSNSSEVSLWQTGGIMCIEADNSSVVKAKADITEADIKVSNGSNVTVAGKTTVLKVKTSGLSKTDLEQLEARDGEVEQSGSSKCHVNVTDNLKVNLTGGAMLTYKRKPSIEVERIVSSTLVKSDDPKRK